jgi:hypothetical protein
MKNTLKIPSDRSFGYTFAVVFTLLGAWLAWRGNGLFWAALGVAAVFGGFAAVLPRVLHPLNVVWMRFGALLNKIVSPVVLGAIYVVLFVPVGLFFRLTKRDALRRAWQPELASYWIDRTPPGPDSGSFPRQF